FVAGASQEAAGLSGYFASGMAGYEEIGRVTARYGRLGIWRGNVLHSGLIHANTAFSPDPRLGRLTLNLFLRLTRNPS
ncbi:MAG: hypothetical protein KGM49_14545, partial [Sphingomonadales bacterium]|nr:hypothetical protein [Sphingomonadales bacterium]